MSRSLSTANLRTFRATLLAWYAHASRDLPWRKTRDPYAIIVSELMLQQTQVERVIPKYIAWMKKFPTVKALARASTRDILAAWQGLGYNRRARFLHVMAKNITEKYDGVFSNTLEGLQQLPGIGPYTARAVMNFAFLRPAPIVETNVRRVLSRIFFGFEHTVQLTETEYWDLANVVTPKKDHYNFNQAIMDFGAVICTAKKPRCATCPFQKKCSSYPRILDAQPQQLRVTKKANEKIYFGKPRRIWRGKILTYLHTAKAYDMGATLLEIGSFIQPDYTAKRDTWLTEVLTTLIKDGMVTKRKNRYHVAL